MNTDSQIDRLLIQAVEILERARGLAWEDDDEELVEDLAMVLATLRNY